MTLPRLLVTRKLPAEVETRIGHLFNAELNPEDAIYDPATLLAKATGKDAILATVTDRLTAETIQAPWRSRCRR